MSATPACADLSSKEADELFFTRAYQQMARVMCHRCPVAAQCLALALKAEGHDGWQYRHGVYGGTTASERARAANP